jgi:phosphate transport system permease protein
VNRKTREKLYFTLFRACGAIVVIALIVLLGYLIYFGIGKISLDFLTQPARAGNTQGGILNPLLGTIYLMLLVLAIAIPVGILSAIYLVEYQRSLFMKGLWRVVVHNLAGVPSVVYGLLGLGLFVILLSLGSSLLAAGLTLSVLALPIIIAATREALLAVPDSLRDASIALGATKWQTVRHHVLPYAMPGVLTGVILSLSRSAGETAPILLVGAAFYLPELPDSLLSQFTALPTYIYQLATQTRTALTGPTMYGAALVLIGLVVTMNLAAIYLRNKYRKKYRW